MKETRDAVKNIRTVERRYEREIGHHKAVLETVKSILTASQDDTDEKHVRVVDIIDSELKKFKS